MISIHAAGRHVSPPVLNVTQKARNGPQEEQKRLIRSDFKREVSGAAAQNHYIVLIELPQAK
jgi:hypothetical protein